MTLVAHHRYRAADHKSRLVDIIQQLFGADGINLEKQGLEGTMENFKYAFGALLDLQRREVRVPGAKLKKAYDIAAKFLEKSGQVISCGEAQRLRGVLGSMTCWCPSMSALVLPRLDRRDRIQRRKGQPRTCNTTRGMHSLPRLQGRARFRNRGMGIFTFVLRFLFSVSQHPKRRVNEGPLRKWTPPT